MKISFIGSGNVATHLAKALHKLEDVNILQIMSRTEYHAKRLAKQVMANATHRISQLDPDFDLLIISIKDDAISSVIQKLDFPNHKSIVHTAGSVPADILKDASDNFGILYPLQTFSKDKEIAWSEVPILISASTEKLENKLVKLASRLSTRPQVVSDQQRFAIHLAAVVACNFSNAIWTMAHNVCTRNRIKFDLLRPLIEETVAKIWELGPKPAQTGPAIRNDQSIMKKHLEVLSHQPLEKNIYSLLSEFIIKQSNIEK